MTITTASPLNAVHGVASSVVLACAGGVGPYTNLRLALGSAPLPAGVTLTPATLVVNFGVGTAAGDTIVLFQVDDSAVPAQQQRADAIHSSHRVINLRARKENWEWSHCSKVVAQAMAPTP